MKILFSYPPLDKTKGYPTLKQNRQFQYFAAPTFIYPVVPATAATSLHDEGREVLWNDCSTEGMETAAYQEKWGRRDPMVRKQLDFSYRFVGVFFENRKWHRLARHPLLALGMYALRMTVGVRYVGAQWERAYEKPRG